MRPGAAAAVAVIAGLVAAAAVTACAETTVDPSRTTPVSAAEPAPTTVFTPTGTARELLPQLSTEVSRLGALVVDGEGEEVALARIEALWAAARDEVASTRPELEASFVTAVALARTAVERRRPADADKAFRNITALVDDYVGDG